jgi:hypothetical protein
MPLALLTPLLALAAVDRPADAVELLPYFLPSAANANVVIQLNTGEYFQTIAVPGPVGRFLGRMYLVKNPTGSNYEEFAWDANFIYHLKDTSWSTANNVNVTCKDTANLNKEAAFTLVDTVTVDGNDPCAGNWQTLLRNSEGGKWVKRSMVVGETFVNARSVFSLAEDSCQCCNTDHDGHTESTMRFNRQEMKSFPLANGTTWTVDVVEFEVTAGSGLGDKFWYGRDLGLIAFKSNVPRALLPGRLAPAHRCAPGGCTDLCSDCILSNRPDVLNFFRDNGWKTDCSLWDDIANNWCGSAVTDCNSVKSGACAGICTDFASPWIPIANATMESQSSSQFGPIANFGPFGGWANHAEFSLQERSALGVRFGFYSAGSPAAETVGQVLTTRIQANTSYRFQSWVTGGGNSIGRVPFEIGYANVDNNLNSWVPLNRAEIDVSGFPLWFETPGVTFTTGQSHPSVNKQLAIRYGSGGFDDIWFDNLQVTKKPVLMIRNANIETNASAQFGPIDFFLPNGGWALHSQFPKPGNAGLGTRFGFYQATNETVSQILPARFEPNRSYTFQAAVIGGGNNLGRVPFQIGYAAVNNNIFSFTLLASFTVDTGSIGTWFVPQGVTYTTPPAGIPVGRQIILRLGNFTHAGFDDIWFDNLTLTVR